MFHCLPLRPRSNPHPFGWSGRQGVILSTMILVLGLLIMVPSSVEANSVKFNSQVERRVLDRLNDFMDAPIKVNNAMEKFLDSGVFEHDLDARDRDEFVRLAYALMHEFDLDYVYFGLEDGTSVM